MSSTLGGPPRLPWKITRWKYNFSAVEPGIWTEFSLFLALSLSLFPVFFVLHGLPFYLLLSFCFLTFTQYNKAGTHINIIHIKNAYLAKDNKLENIVI